MHAIKSYSFIDENTFFLLLSFLTTFDKCPDCYMEIIYGPPKALAHTLHYNVRITVYSEMVKRSTITVNAVVIEVSRVAWTL